MFILKPTVALSAGLTTGARSRFDVQDSFCHDRYNTCVYIYTHIHTCLCRNFFKLPVVYRALVNMA